MSKAEDAGKIAGKLGALIIFSALTALLFNFTIGLFIEYPLTWGNFGKTWLALICFNLLANRIKGVKIA